jgi:endonuclease-3
MKRTRSAETAQKRPRLETLELIRRIRTHVAAPVDSLGCQSLAESNCGQDVFEFQVLIGALLSSQTKDERTAEAVRRLKERGGKGVSSEWVKEQSIDEIADAIRPVGFYNQKAKYLKQIADILHEKYDKRVPRTYDQLIQLPGIGPKMASLILSCGFGQNDSICVDTHVHRISKTLQWGCHKCVDCKDVEHTRLALQSWLPQDLWGDFSLHLVGLGQLLNTGKEKLIAYTASIEEPQEKDDTEILLMRLGI